MAGVPKDYTRTEEAFRRFADISAWDVDAKTVNVRRNTSVEIAGRQRRGIVERRSGRTPAVGEQGEKVFVARAGEHRRQADENVAVVDPGIKVMTLAGR